MRRATCSSGTRTASAARSASTSRAKRCSSTHSGADVVSIRAAIERKWTPGQRRRPERRHRAPPAEEVTQLETSASATSAFARLFQSVREGVYMGTLGANSTTTLAANPHLKTIFGYPAGRRREPRPAVRHRPASSIRRRATTSSSCSIATAASPITCFASASVDGTPIWIEVSATASHRPLRSRPVAARRRCTSRRWSATSASARSATIRSATAATRCCRPRRWPRSARPSPASRTS